MKQQHRETRVALLSVASNMTLVLMKLIVGLIVGSVSVISEAIHSGVDLINIPEHVCQWKSDMTLVTFCKKIALT